MLKISYPAVLDPDGSGFAVRFPDLPEALTGGKDEAEALERAADCLGCAIFFRMKDKADIPPPSRLNKGERLISAPLHVAPKAALYLAMRDSGISNSALARRLGVTELVVRRMLDPRHASKPERLSAALLALGKRLVVGVEDAA